MQVQELKLILEKIPVSEWVFPVGNQIEVQAQVRERAKVLAETLKRMHTNILYIQEELELKVDYELRELKGQYEIITIVLPYLEQAEYSARKISTI
jgi:hypothetical protein